uniref:Ig-like domain-containing protein n=1 Tax=Astyanax mexicanus TaxID=7994 RepID=A0A3B1KF95_ASTMX
ITEFLLIYAVNQSCRNTEPSIVSVEVGESVTLNCTSALIDKSKTAYWFKHRLEHKPQEVGYKLGEKNASLLNQFIESKSGFELKEVGSGVSLSIKQVQKEDEGMYFCGSISENSVNFSTGTFLAVSDHSNISVLQTPALQSVPPGEAVNLQCTVLSEIRSAELRVFWIRSAAGSSFPEIIFTHHNSSSSSSSSRQCEISSSKHSSVYNFSPNIPNNHHAATYYCAVETCGRIIIGNGTTVDLRNWIFCLISTYLLCISNRIRSIFCALMIQKKKHFFTPLYIV